MKQSLIYILLFIAFIANAQAQYPTFSTSEVNWSIQSLYNTGSVLYIAAHPDDENTRLISYLAKEKQYRVGYLSLTRGDGGQNLIGAEQGIDLGVIRTEELRAARSIDGGQQFFTRAYDFGYSKSPEETFTKWSKDSLLKDMVEVIRYFKPDVIICRFPTTGEGGHGHHTASALLANDAFDLAADVSYAPEQVKAYGTWQAKRLLWNTFNFNQEAVDRTGEFEYNVGAYVNELGRHIAEIASTSRSQHKSQGFGAAALRGPQFEYFKLLKGAPIQNDLLDGVDVTWQKTGLSKNVTKQLDKIVKAKTDAERVSLLIGLRKDLLASVNKESLLAFKPILTDKINTIERLIFELAGVWLEATSDKPFASKGLSHTLEVKLLSYKQEKIEWLGYQLEELYTSVNKILPPKEMENLKTTTVFEHIYDGAPYWLQNGIRNDLFDLANVPQHFWPVVHQVPLITFELKIQGERFNIARPVQYRYVDPVKGERYEMFRVLPNLSVSLQEAVMLLPNNNSKEIHVDIKSLQPEIKGHLIVEGLPRAAYEILDGADFEIERNNHTIEKVIMINSAGLPKGTYKMRLAVVSGEDTIRVQYQTISYDHIPLQQVAKPLDVTIVREDVQIPKHKVAFVDGAGEKTYELLKALGVDIERIDISQMTLPSLGKYKTILFGIRAFNVNENLFDYNDLLNAYIKQGGKVVVQYNTNSRVGPLKGQIGPYPFEITRNRVTDEAASISINAKEHPFFNTPNTITDKDFDKWVQERGIYFAGKYEANYVSLLSMADFNEQPLEGSLIYTTYGKGAFVYTGLALFRQLPAGVPGAYRLLMNILN